MSSSSGAQYPPPIQTTPTFNADYYGWYDKEVTFRTGDDRYILRTEIPQRFLSGATSVLTSVPKSSTVSVVITLPKTLSNNTYVAMVTLKNCTQPMTAWTSNQTNSQFTISIHNTHPSTDGTCLIAWTVIY